MVTIRGKSCVANYFLSFLPIVMKFGPDVCLGVGVNVQDNCSENVTFSPRTTICVLSLWTSGTKCLYCVSNLSNLGLKLLKKISILSQTCLGQNVSIWSQFETFLTFETQLRLPLFESNLRAIWDIFLRCQKGVKKVSNTSQKGIWGI